jgi:hypothetical protein
MIVGRFSLSQTNDNTKNDISTAFIVYTSKTDIPVCLLAFVCSYNSIDDQYRLGLIGTSRRPDGSIRSCLRGMLYPSEFNVSSFLQSFVRSRRLYEPYNERLLYEIVQRLSNRDRGETRTTRRLGRVAASVGIVQRDEWTR